jgi:hypothetical protein
MTWNKPINDDLIRLKKLEEAYDYLADPPGGIERWPEHDALMAGLRGEIEWMRDYINQTAKLIRDRGGRI